jgi:two-component system OmpR family sensor kinase/two-component system sensor histidine kinase BaeS
MGVFLGVIALGVIIMVVSVRISTASHLEKRVLSDDVAQANGLASLLADYYSRQGGWAGVEKILADVPLSVSGDNLGWNMGSGMMGPGMMGDGMGQGVMEWMQGWFQVTRSTGPLSDRVVILDSAGWVVADTGGASLDEQHPPGHVQDAVPVVVDGEPVGAVLVGSMIEPVLNPADEDFLRSVNLSILITSIAVGLLALVLGSLLFRQITSPLQDLSQAAEAVAAGQLGQRVEIKTGDEIGRLGESFNHMAENLAGAEVQRRNMVADIAHELRTPLTVVQGNLEALLDGVYDLNLENVAAIHRQSTLLSRLVADLRDLALADAGQLRLEWQPVNLAALIEQVTEGLETQAGEKGVTLKVDLAETFPRLNGDEQRIKQVLFNLISNAIRHTPSGGSITTEGEVKGDRVVARVRDTGSGIPPQDLPHIFERFYRADRSRSRATGGSGLGLTISKRIIELHGGQIWAQSWSGVGSTFAFSLPLERRGSVSLPDSQPPANCHACGKATEPDWRLCAYCGRSLFG